MASTMVVPPSKHTLFMRGFTTRQSIDKIREFFTREAGGCTVEFFKESENRERLFVALRFDTKDIARDILNRYDQGEVLGDRISISWFKDLRRARQKAASQGQFHRGGWDPDPTRYQYWEGFPSGQDYHGGNRGMMHPADENRRNTQRNASPLRNGFRPGQYKGNFRSNDYNGPPQNNWQRQNQGSGRGRNSGRRYEKSSSRSRSRSGSSSRTYSRSRSRSHSPSRSHDRDRSKSRSRSYSRSRDRSKTPDSRQSRSPVPLDKRRERDDSTDHSVRDRTPERANGYEKQPRNRWEDPKNGDSFPADRNGTGHYDPDDHDSYHEREVSPPRNRQVRSAVTTVAGGRDDGYEDNEFGSDDAAVTTTPTTRRYSGGPSTGPPQPSPVPPPSSHSNAASHGRGGGDHDSVPMREPDTPGGRSGSGIGGDHEKVVYRSRQREHDPPPVREPRETRERFPSDRDRSTERYQNQPDVNPGTGSTSEAAPGGGSARDMEPSAHRSRSPSIRSERSHPDQDHYDDRRLDRKRSLSGGDDHGRYVDAENDHKKSRYLEEEKVEKVKRPMAKRTRGAETLDDEVDERDLPDRGALGLPHEKMIMVREKKEEIEKAYRQDCETFAAVVKMLVSKDSDLESKLQQSLRENLKEIGQRCIQELREFINKVKVEEHS